jgi:hypothetical protein
VTRAEQVIECIEAVGGALAIRGERIRCRLPQDATYLVEELRECRSEVLSALLRRETIQPVAPGVRLVKWNLKEPPIAIETCAIVTEPGLFARTTIEQLRIALENPERSVGWSIPQLVDRLEQVGVKVALEIDKSTELES